jgi:hypothetical protein
VRPERRDVPLDQSQAALERAIIDEFFAAHGYDPRQVNGLPEAQRLAIRREAALYAAARLAEHEARAHYVQEIHGATEPIHKRPR